MLPDYETIMLPLLEFVKNEQEHSTRDAIEHISKLFSLTEEEKRKLLPSGRERVIDNRVGWARTYLKKAGLLEYTKRAYFRITENGLEVLKQKPSKIDVKFLEQFPGFIQFKSVKREKKEPISSKLEAYDLKTPLELLEEGYQKIRSDLAQDLLTQVKKSSPNFFEKLVVDLLLKMGYGGSQEDAGKAIGQTGDGGIDGIINEDKLGLDVIYIQAKRWEGTVGRPEIHKFVGALEGQRARKGIFITTSDFSKDAEDYAKTIGTKVVLINGEQLVRFMIENDVGVSKLSSYEIKRIDSDYFSE